jgi:uroporphyrinogen-III decarboxylase
VWWFDRTDMSRAKATVGKVSCIAGNVPLDLLCTGSPDEMRTYCKNLIEDAGKDGGFILSSGAGIQGSKAANVMAMIESSIEYGAYN